MVERWRQRRLAVHGDAAFRHAGARQGARGERSQ
jgi:hypothetical protein